MEQQKDVLEVLAEVTEQLAELEKVLRRELSPENKLMLHEGAWRD